MFSKRLFYAILVSPLALFAADSAPQAVQTVRNDGTAAGITQYLVALPHIAYGGGWRTQIVIGNASGSPTDVSLRYFGSDGNPLSVPIGGVSSDHTDLTIPANGEQIVEPDWRSTDTAVGWVGFVYSNGGVKIQGIFLWHSPADPADKNMEATVPIVNQSGAGCVIPLPGGSSYTMPYDETEGRSSGYGFANTTAGPVTMRFTFYDQGGKAVAQYSQQLPAFGHDQWVTRDKLPQLLGQKGTMVISGQGIVPLGFRFAPYNTFTTWQP